MSYPIAPCMFLFNLIFNKVNCLPLCRLPAPNQMFSISVMADIKSEKPISYNDLNGVIKKAVKNHALGELTIKEDGYSLTVVKGNLILQMIFCFEKMWIAHFG